MGYNNDQCKIIEMANVNIREDLWAKEKEQRRERDRQTTNIKYGRGYIIINATDGQRVVSKYYDHLYPGTVLLE